MVVGDRVSVGFNVFFKINSVFRVEWIVSVILGEGEWFFYGDLRLDFY